jgi:hypothetical protein
MAKKNKRNIFNQIIEEPEVKNEVIESTPVVVDPEELIAEDEFITSEAAKEPHFEFKEEYFLGTPSETSDKETVIDTLPKEECDTLPKEECICDENCVCTEPCACDTPVVEAPKPQRELSTLTRDEYRHYLRTGSIPQ